MTAGRLQAGRSAPGSHKNRLPPLPFSPPVRTALPATTQPSGLTAAATVGPPPGIERCVAQLQGGDTAVRGELLNYCRHDTEAMVRLLRFFTQS